ncbi:MAG: glycosyltransferase family 4 protein [Cyanobacteria bacterium P01_F01_bin.150]
MSYHIILSIPFDLEGIHQQAETGQRPRHAMWDLGQKLGATIHKPDPNAVTLQDKALAMMCSHPAQWALARKLVKQLTADDTVFCVGEDVGLPFALLCNDRLNHPKLVVKVMAPERLRVRTLLSAFNLGQSIDLFLTNTQIKAKTIQKITKVGRDRIYVLPEQTDARFFTPDVPQPKTRSLIASAGREQRDYKTLAIATQDLEVDIEVCALSPNASKGTRVAFPEPIPSNMSFHPYDWLDFRQMYRNADLVVVSLLDNHYSAGLTVLMEAMACRRPVLITRTPGLSEILIDKGIVAGVDPGDTEGMRQVITHYLDHPDEAEALAEKGYQYFQAEHTSELFISRLVEKMEKVSKGQLTAEPHFLAA